MPHTDSHKLISFCVPTYEQPSQMRRLLDSLVGQELEEVEIVIRDDSPGSETEGIVSEYSGKLPIRYFHKEKSGIDLAFLFLSEVANGEFVWWFGDDVLCPGVMGKVVDILKQNRELDFMYINSTGLDGSEYSVDFGESRLLNDRNEVLSILKDQLGFCSAMLFKKETLLSGAKESFNYIGTSWVTLFLALNVLSKGSSFYLLGGKNFLSDVKPAGEDRWYDSFEVHGINYFIILNAFKDRFDPKVLRDIIAYKYGASWRAVVTERALGYRGGFASPSPKIWKMTRFYWNYPEFYIALPLMLLPRFVLRVFYALYKTVIKKPIKALASIDTEETPVICPRDGTQLRFDDEASAFHCSSCQCQYQKDDGVVRLLEKTDEFYEGAYEGQVKFLPRSERPWHVWPIWLINSGYLWRVRQHVPEGGRVVELGCAAGVKYFGERYRMIGCDVSLSSLKKLGGIYDSLIQADVLKCIPLPDNSVDAVISSFFWEHISPDIKPRILSECHRILKPGGKIVFLYDVETSNPLIRRYKKANPDLYRQLFIEGDGHFGYQRPLENLALFQEAGFRVLKHQGMEKTCLQSASTYSKLAKFGGAWQRFFRWSQVFERSPWFHLSVVVMRVIDTIVGPLLPKDHARIDIVVLEREGNPPAQHER